MDPARAAAGWPPKAAGTLFVHNGHVLLLKRSGSAKAAPGTWGFPGGGIEPGETPEVAARRELREECGFAYDGTLSPLYTSQDGFMCFGAALAKPFTPQLNDEHSAARWAPFDDLPQPLHPGMAALAALCDVKVLHAIDAAPPGWRATLAELRRIVDCMK